MTSFPAVPSAINVPLADSVADNKMRDSSDSTQMARASDNDFFVNGITTSTAP